LLKSLINFNY